MINHARTLLMNISPLRANYADSGYEGYEYIPPDFRPVAVPVALKNIRRVLFGENPDGLYRGMRAHELLSYIHQTDLADYVYALDPRVTYWPPTDAVLADRKKIIVTQTYGPPRRVFIGGELLASDKTGTSYRSYIAALGKTSISAENLTLYVRHLEPPATVLTTPFIPPDTPVVPLPQSGLTLRVAEGALRGAPTNLKTEIGQNVIVENFDQIGYGKLVLETPTSFNIADLTTIVAQWYIVTRALPDPAITTTINVLENLGEVTFLGLFGVDPAEPYATFKNLWEDHPLPAYRLAGITLALIYRTEEYRNHG
jgi:hypothetical protein